MITFKIILVGTKHQRTNILCSYEFCFQLGFTSSSLQKLMYETKSLWFNTIIVYEAMRGAEM